MSETARILDRGYRHYTGERRGVGGAIRSVAIQSLQRVLGIKRSFWAKIVPILMAFFAYVPAIAFVGFAIIVPDELRLEGDILGSYADYYGNITLAIVLFSALAGPQVLIPDRRTGMLGLYLASPLDRDTYLLAKAIAVALLLSIVTLGPPLLLLVGNTAAGAGPDGFAEWIGVFADVVIAGAVISLLLTTLTMAISSVTTRIWVAGASVVIVLLASLGVAVFLVEGAEASDYVGLVSLITLPLELVVRIYGEGARNADDRLLSEVSTAAIALAYVAWTTAFAVFVRFRYQRLDVTR